ncbi:carbohydrate sulfotransferase 15 [Striga asiatica]|uniref:Carbohydrate sulfotransferase 15 n=1 Tax=Striga asiatica TaxID=4170 RepID=A0A5A7QZ31_STRAF|nr:carbohydrate sulfotransferase 15 [Striga asiatica]
MYANSYQIELDEMFPNLWRVILEASTWTGSSFRFFSNSSITARPPACMQKWLKASLKSGSLLLNILSPVIFLVKVSKAHYHAISNFHDRARNLMLHTARENPMLHVSSSSKALPSNCFATRGYKKRTTCPQSS